MKHSMKCHTSVEDVVKRIAEWEDMDTWPVIGRTESGDIEVSRYGYGEGFVASTLLEALYLLHPNCYCEDEDGDEEHR